ncbi:hypothetical protein FF125_16100 [Aureibaculum algae]|uniref:Uncharacterized protein n=1 Tax=Aureibaculum algae TaxID=2584122 RepID=A0A5B7TWK5_9FLAO|nr:hypothetical protein [Aureibaculum algae]QCX39042.1 hypothetical protein FF125_11575 [Aureibaculum algae]QCX39885.1 hypothetical protein FF125_16100 [Aureibaculum algae]
MKYKILILIILTLSIGIESYACNCGIPKSLELEQDYNYENSECIFVGEVLEVNKTENTFTIKVIESFNGNDNLNVYKGTYDEQCGPIIDTKGKWLIYANLNSDNILVVGSCGISRNFKNPEYNVTIEGLLIKEFKGTAEDQGKKFNDKGKKDLKVEIERLRVKKEE